MGILHIDKSSSSFKNIKQHFFYVASVTMSLLFLIGCFAESSESVYYADGILSVEEYKATLGQYVHQENTNTQILEIKTVPSILVKAGAILFAPDHEYKKPEKKTRSSVFIDYSFLTLENKTSNIKQSIIKSRAALLMINKKTEHLSRTTPSYFKTLKQKRDVFFENALKESETVAEKEHAKQTQNIATPVNQAKAQPVKSQKSELKRIDNTNNFGDIPFDEDPQKWAGEMIGTWEGVLGDRTYELTFWPADHTHYPRRSFSAILRSHDGVCEIYYISGNDKFGEFYPILPNRAGESLIDSAYLQHYFRRVDFLYENGENKHHVNAEQCRIRGFSISKLHRDDNLYLKERGKLNTQDAFNENRHIELKRVSASAGMLQTINKLLKHNKPAERSFYNPDNVEWELIKNKDARYKDYASRLKISCWKSLDFARSLANAQGIGNVSATRSGNQARILVSKLSDRHNPVQISLPARGNIDWNNTTLSGKDATRLCDEANATIQVLKALQISGKLENSQVLGGASADIKKVPLIKKIVNMHIIDAFGVEKVSKQSYDSSGSNNKAFRVFGVKNTFGPGDNTRVVTWNPRTQRLFLKSRAKSTKSVETRADTENRGSERAFFYDDALSKKYGVDIFASATAKRTIEECAEWRGSYNANNCTRKLRVGAEIPKAYITASQDAAIGIYKELSPNPSTWGGISSKPACPTGVFCSLAGGDYLNAIYRGDARKVAMLNQEKLRGQVDAIESHITSYSHDRNVQAAVRDILFPGYKKGHVSMLPMTINEYMYGYKNYPKTCLRDDALIFRKSYTSPKLLSSDPWGGSTVSGGIKQSVEYLINKEFKKPCDATCAYREAIVANLLGDAIIGRGYISQIKNGLAQMQRQYGCNSPEIEQFEENLISIFSRTDSGPERWVRSSE